MHLGFANPYCIIDGRTINEGGEGGACNASQPEQKTARKERENPKSETEKKKTLAPLKTPLNIDLYCITAQKAMKPLGCEGEGRTEAKRKDFQTQTTEVVGVFQS